MPKRIENLTIKDFRGATVPLEIVFEPTKPMVMIFGENGTGKSSIVDAFDFICNQKYGSIEERSSIKKKEHSPAIGKKKNDILITLRFDGKDWSANHQGNDPTTTPTGFPCANILRRSNILKVIDAEPNKRYTELDKFLSVPNIEKCEQTLKNAIRTQERECNDSFNSVQQAKEELENLQKELSEADKSVEQWSKEVTEINEDELNKIIQNADDVNKLQDEYKKAKSLIDEAKSDLAEKQEIEGKAKDELSALQENANAKEDLQKLLTNAQKYFSEHSDLKTCPVCEQGIKHTDVFTRLKIRLDEMAVLTEKIREVELNEKNRQTAETLVKTRDDDYKRRTLELVKKIQEIQGKETNKPEQIDFDKLIAELTESDNKKVETAKIELGKYEKYKASLAEQKAIAEKKQKQQAAVKTLLESIRQKEEKNKKDNAVLTRLKEYDAILPKERKQYTDTILTTVSSEVERLYQLIHPEEGIGGIRFYLNPKYKGSLEYDGVFQGSQNVPPQAYYSDAHLDTLGICMFLALAKHFNDNNTIIVLDDVVTSADEAHRERFLNLLHDEADNYCHIVVTTHYRPWRDFYRVGGGPENKVQFIDLQLWSKEKGIRHAKSKFLREEIRSLLDSITIDNRQTIAAKTGVLLEGVLDQIILIYQLLVPRLPLPRYDLKTLFDSIVKYKKHIKIVQETSTAKNETEFKDVFEPLENMNDVRNKVGCHWNIDGSLFSDAKIKEFGEKTLAFCDAIICAECGNIPNRKQKGENYYKCQCGKTKMYPQQMP